MNRYSNYTELHEQIEILSIIIMVLFGLLLLVVFRNWYNLYKKYSYRNLSKKLKKQLQANENEINRFNEELKGVKQLKEKLSDKHTEIFQLEQQLEEYKKKFYATLSKKDKKIAEQREAIEHQKNAYERYINFKNVEANNTRLGAHFIKNVISQIYNDLERIDENYISIFGLYFKCKPTKNKLPSLKALKNIFKLLDYNVSALNKESTSVKEELVHVTMFLELIQYLKPNAKIEFNISLNEKQRKSIKIKPTLFFPFIENALKHGNLNANNSFISIELKEQGAKQLNYCLVNSITHRLNNEVQESETSKFGLNALKQLVDAYYPGSTLQYNILPNSQYMSQLTLNIKK